MIPYTEVPEKDPLAVPMEFRSISTRSKPIAEKSETSSEQTLAAFTMSLEEARLQGHAQAMEETKSVLEAERMRIRNVIEKFTSEKNHYFADLEEDVVHLAMSVVERILHRESVIEPLLLKGAVYAALKKLSEGTAVNLHVPEQEYALWQQQMDGVKGLTVKPDAALGMQECRLEALVGSLDLGVRSQLKEIEQGFFDLMRRKPEAA